MIRLYLSIGFSCLAVGSIAGYAIERITREPSPAIAAATPSPTPTPKPLTRPELEARLTLCIGKPLSLKALTDKALNDAVAECESLKARS